MPEATSRNSVSGIGISTPSSERAKILPGWVEGAVVSEGEPVRCAANIADHASIDAAKTEDDTVRAVAEGDRVVREDHRPLGEPEAGVELPNAGREVAAGYVVTSSST